MKNHHDINIYSIINSFRSGFKILYNLQNLGSVSGMRVSVASLLGVAGVIFVLRDGKARSFRTLSDKNSLSEKFWVVPGLQNLGNNCFLNVILQALASCSYFRSFIRMRLEEFEDLSFEELVESMPLAVSLDSLLEELCTPRHGREVLSPREVMIAIDHYKHSFNLTNQQDAEEAFFHIVSSLRQELMDSYTSDDGSLAGVTTLANWRFLGLERRLAQTEQQRWKQNILGPFDGILGSILTCRSCSIQISLDFQYFHSLHLSLMAGSSVEACLKHFFAAEQLEHYNCSHCWHIAAIKSISATDENEADAVKLRNCNRQDSCDCRNLSLVRAIPRSNSFSRTFKQLSIARSPKILCLHLQRASVNVFGELVKFQGHISFPLTLNTSRFMNRGVGIKNCEKNLPEWQSKQYPCHLVSFSNDLDLHLDTRRLNNIYEQTKNSIFSEVQVPEEFGQATSGLVSAHVQDFQGQSMLFQTEGFSDHTLPIMNTHMQCDDKVCVAVPEEDVQVIIDAPSNTNIQDSQRKPNMSCIEDYPNIAAQNDFNNKMVKTRDSAPAEHDMYRLVSVVQHFGNAGGGHYTIYRRVRANSKDGGPNQIQESNQIQWFGISDSQVYSVSEDDVLAAEASLLFYEKISEMPIDHSYP